MCYQRYSSRIYRQMREYLSKINAELSETLLCMSVIQQFGQENRVLKEFEKINESYLKKRFAMIKADSLFLYPVVTLMFVLAEVIASAICISWSYLCFSFLFTEFF